jgi:mono/diheme cytochrome c family protein
MIDYKTIWHRTGCLGVPLLLFMASSPAVFAQDVGDAEAGRRLSETWCSTCHVVTATQSQGAGTGAAFLQTPHHQMPDLHLSREEIGDVAAYIRSLRAPEKS